MGNTHWISNVVVSVCLPRIEYEKNKLNISKNLHRIPGLQGKSSDNSIGQTVFKLSDEQISWIASINMLFVPIGALISGLFMESLGKRRMMQVHLFFTFVILFDDD